MSLINLNKQYTEMSNIRKCVRCGKENAPFQKFSENLNTDSNYCEECWNYNHEEVQCTCGEKVKRQELPLHISSHPEI